MSYWLRNGDSQEKCRIRDFFRQKSVALWFFSVRKVYFCRLKKTCHHVEKKGLCFTLPLYIGFLLDFDDDDKIELQDLDIEAVNRFANEYSM